MALDTITGYVTSIVSEPIGLGWLILGVVLSFIIVFTLRQFLDFAVDLWKLPFAVALDFVDMMAYNNPFMDLAAAGGCVLLFWILAKRGDHIGKLLGIVATAEALIGVWIFPNYAYITNLVPTATIMVFILIWSD